MAMQKSETWTDPLSNGFCAICESHPCYQEMLTCARCGIHVHEKCYEPPLNLRPCMRKEWCCFDCKTCLICKQDECEEDIIICVSCDRGMHIFCCNPPLTSVPEGDWICENCRDERSPTTGKDVMPEEAALMLDDGVHEIPDNSDASLEDVNSTIEEVPPARLFSGDHKMVWAARVHYHKYTLEQFRYDPAAWRRMSHSKQTSREISLSTEEQVKESVSWSSLLSGIKRRWSV